MSKINGIMFIVVTIFLFVTGGLAYGSENKVVPPDKEIMSTFQEQINVYLSTLPGTTPLNLRYLKEDLGNGYFRYVFSLSLDNEDDSWVPGQGWSWVTFGDAQQDTSPIDDFKMDPDQFPLGPWTSLGKSFGSHNGPTLSPVQNFWIPETVGESFTWSGTSRFDAKQRDILFSTLWETGSAIRSYYQQAIELQLCYDFLNLQSYSTSYDQSDPRAPAGVFTINATFKNGYNAILKNILFKTVKLTGDNEILNADRGSVGVGSIVTVPSTDLGPDGVLDTEESCDLAFEIGLKQRAPFTFSVNAYCIPLVIR